MYCYNERQAYIIFISYFTMKIRLYFFEGGEGYENVILTVCYLGFAGLSYFYTGIFFAGRDIFASVLAEIRFITLVEKRLSSYV